MIDSQGKAPDFVLEVASPTTGSADYTEKRTDYERFGLGEYWRFHPSGGEYHDATLAGDRLVDSSYEPIEVLGEGRLRGYSSALGLYVCWEEGMRGPSILFRRATFGRMRKMWVARRKSGPVAWWQSRVLRSLRPSFGVCAANRALSSRPSSPGHAHSQMPFRADARKYLHLLHNAALFAQAENPDLCSLFQGRNTAPSAASETLSKCVIFTVVQPQRF